MGATLYFDGRCPLCRREVALLERLKSQNLPLRDIHALQLDAYQRRQMLERLHLQFDNGHWALGVEATVAAWLFTRWGFLFRPLVEPLASRFYERWARRRARRLPWINNCEGPCRDPSFDYRR